MLLVGCGGHSDPDGVESVEVWRMVVSEAISDARRLASASAMNAKDKASLATGLEEFRSVGLLDFEVSIEMDHRATFRYLLLGQPMVRGSWEVLDSSTIRATFEESTGLSISRQLILERREGGLWMRVNRSATVPFRRARADAGSPEK